MELFHFLWRASIIDDSHHLVLGKTEYIGSININSFSKLPFRLCLLALILDLENNIHRLAMGNPERALNKAPKRDRDRAAWLYEKKYGRPSDSQSTPELFSCLPFSTKCSILKNIVKEHRWQSHLDMDLLDLAVNIRNNCAHSAPDEAFLQILNHRALWDFTRKLQDLNHDLRKLHWD